MKTLFSVPAWALNVAPKNMFLRDRLAELFAGCAHQFDVLLGMSLIACFAAMDESITPAEDALILDWAKGLSSEQTDMVVFLALIKAEWIEDALETFLESRNPSRLALVCHLRGDLEAMRQLLRLSSSAEDYAAIDSRCSDIDDLANEHGIIELVRTGPVTEQRCSMWQLPDNWWGLPPEL